MTTLPEHDSPATTPSDATENGDTPRLSHRSIRSFVIRAGRTTGAQQRALDTLYGSEQILIGGIYTVRGFVRNVLSGDHGYYLRNELSARRNLALGDHRLPTRVYAGLDFGEVSNRVPDVPSGKLTGMAVGASVSWKGVSFDVFNARPLRFPSYFTREASQTWLRANTAF